MRPFVNEPVLELRRASVRAGLDEALAAVDARGPLQVPVWIGGDRRTGDEIVSTDPGAPSRLYAIAWETERRLCEAIATRSPQPAERPSMRRRVSASKFASVSALCSNTGVGQPCWRASTSSWSQ